MMSKVLWCLHFTYSSVGKQRCFSWSIYSIPYRTYQPCHLIHVSTQLLVTIFRRLGPLKSHLPPS